MRRSRPRSAPLAAQRCTVEAKFVKKFLPGSSFVFSALVSPKVLLPSDRRKDIKHKLVPVDRLLLILGSYLN